MVSSIILALLAAGFFTTLMSARYFVSRSKRRLTAVEIARREIENKRQYISADRWYCLTNASFNPLNASGAWTSWDSANYTPYRVRYKVEGTGFEYRKITVQVDWNATSI